MKSRIQERVPIVTGGFAWTMVVIQLIRVAPIVNIEPIEHALKHTDTNVVFPGTSTQCLCSLGSTNTGRIFPIVNVNFAVKAIRVRYFGT